MARITLLAFEALQTAVKYLTIKHLTIKPNHMIHSNFSIKTSLCIFFLILIALVQSAVAHDASSKLVTAAERLPLGDGKISTVPQSGFVMACNTRFGGGGAHKVGEWIDVSTSSWSTVGKPQVEGMVQWSNARIAVTREGDNRMISANNLPTHNSGQFPIRAGSIASNYDRNPNSIKDRVILLSLPAEPKLAAQPSCIPMGMVGFALSGVAIFNAFDAMRRDAPAYEIQDACNGHPQRAGQYHYHDWSPCLAKNTTGQAYTHDEPVGWMLDGFPILGPIGKDNKAITNADLDECHGRVGDVRIDGVLKSMYHYRFTMTYPYTIGCFRGSPVKT